LQFASKHRNFATYPTLLGILRDARHRVFLPLLERRRARVPNDDLFRRYLAARDDLRVETEPYVADGAYRGARREPHPMTPEARARIEAKFREVADAFRAWLDSD
jgi:hypothetical protein